tara:strand:+ start:6137 stop:7012 length:876 start_codon:yes stop_codon:yes gene_type:complete
MCKFNNKNFLDLLNYTKKFFFQKLGNKNSINLENKYKKYYISKILNNKLIVIDIDKNKKIFFPFQKMGLKTTADLFGYYEHLIFLLYYLKSNEYKKRAADIGSNLGLHSIILSIFGYKVDSFEPDPDHYKFQKKILKLNKASNVRVFNKGVYDENCKKNLYKVLDNPYANFVQGEKKGYGKLKKIKIKLIDIKKIIYKYDLVKIDAEGSEAKIITSLKKKDHLKTDFIVEVSGRENAQKILNHCNKFRINVFSHKNSWKKVHNLNKMPLHHSEGLIVITKDKSYFNFLRAN